MHVLDRVRRIDVRLTARLLSPEGPSKGATDGEAWEESHGRPQRCGARGVGDAGDEARSRRGLRDLPHHADSARAGSMKSRSNVHRCLHYRPRVTGSRNRAARCHRLHSPRLVSGQSPAAFAAGGKSGLHRARWWVTPTVRKDRDSATENIPPDCQLAGDGKGEMVR